jgi:hypothetical protein
MMADTRNLQLKMKHGTDIVFASAI